MSSIGPVHIPKTDDNPRSGARLLIDALERMGVDTMFGYPGER
ncbi:MAG: hypothetical protein WDM89_03005 [Rhizomicrobium sp.]